jgi:protein-tyrosine phosphatase
LSSANKFHPTAQNRRGQPPPANDVLGAPSFSPYRSYRPFALFAASPYRRIALSPIRFAFSPPSRYPREVTKKVLFICTGNFYRSRFAEAVFNFHADQRKLRWQAYSRGLAIHWADGVLSPFTAAALSERQIPISYTGADRTQLTENDLESADLRIALDRAEHLQMMEQQFPSWTRRVQYWEVPDMPTVLPEVALPSIESQILHLLDHLPNDP